MWTIGHSNRTKEAFLELLRGHSIEVLADVRSFPTSKIAHFKREQIEHWLPEHGIDYVWLGKELGGYREGGYKRHMRTKPFREGIRKLLVIGAQKRVCIMCMEPDPKHCHRCFISTYLECKRVRVNHILTKSANCAFSIRN